MILKCLVADDEPIARKIIQGYIDKMPELECAGTSQNGIETLSFLSSNEVDIVFLDINMPELNGLDVAKSLDSKNGPAIIFTTAYPEYAVEGFEVEAVDYLVKPISFDRFYKAVERVKSMLEKENPKGLVKQTIFIRADRKQHQVDLEEIQFLEAYGDYVKVHCQDRMLLTKDTLSNMEKQLPAEVFVRTHRSYIVRFSAVDYIEGNHLRIGQHTIPISQAYRKKLDLS